MIAVNVKRNRQYTILLQQVIDEDAFPVTVEQHLDDNTVVILDYAE